MENKVQENIVSFFGVHVLKHKTKWAELEENLRQLIKVLSNRIEQYSNCEKFDTRHSEYEELPYVYENLLGTLLVEMDSEIEAINAIIGHFNKLNQELKNKATIMERSTFELDALDCPVLFNGSIYQPAVNQLLKWAADVCGYYRNRKKLICNGVSQINCHKQSSLEELNIVLNKKDDMRDFEEIIQFTQFVKNNFKNL